MEGVAVGNKLPEEKNREGPSGGLGRRSGNAADSRRIKR